MLLHAVLCGSSSQEVATNWKRKNEYETLSSCTHVICVTVIDVF